ncbi:La ribonucleoprotein [Ranunculus cassubicifolius]
MKRKRSEQEQEQEPPIDNMYEEVEDPAEDDEAEAEEEENNQAEAERPKLAEGFFEIEAVRGKRTRKGKRQYLIKWRGWPETANTWEPFDNLQSCSDIIQAFEQRSAKTSRKRKRKHTTTTTSQTTQPPKKKKQRDTSTSPSTTTAQPNHNNTLSNLTHPPHHGVDTGKAAETNDYMLLVDKNHDDALQPNVVYHFTENGYTNVDVSVDDNHNEETNGADPEFCKLPGALLPPNGLDTGNISIQVPDTGASEKDEQSKPETSGRFIGAKRRKSGRVRRFKQDSVSATLDETHPSIPAITNGPTSLVFEPFANDAREIDCLENPSAIIKIIKPVGYSTSISNDVHDVSLIFRVMRYLISYYEQHLRYTPPPT